MCPSLCGATLLQAIAVAYRKPKENLTVSRVMARAAEPGLCSALEQAYVNF